MINQSTGVVGADISGPVACVKRLGPDNAAGNAGTLNYLKARESGGWAWPPLIFDNPVEKVDEFLKVMKETESIPEFECF
ncbi:3-keto-5-aminohexanoate cleavage protein, partial [Acinetobacter baumannii]